jgi:hypothetical protein
MGRRVTAWMTHYAEALEVSIYSSIQIFFVISCFPAVQYRFEFVVGFLRATCARGRFLLMLIMECSASTISG